MEGEAAAYGDAPAPTAEHGRHPQRDQETVTANEAGEWPSKNSQ